MVDCRFEAAVAGCVLQLPGIPTLIVLKAREIVAFVEVFEDRREDLREFFGKADSLGGGLEKLATANGSEEW